MARPLRITFPNAFYHVTSRGNERKDVFKSERDRDQRSEIRGQKDPEIRGQRSEVRKTQRSEIRGQRSERSKTKDPEVRKTQRSEVSGQWSVYTHYHLLLETPRANLSQIMHHINGAYTTYFNVKRDRSGHLFQGRYKAILVEKDEYAKELSRYIHLNPVRAKMVDAPEDYPWSSYPYYIGMKPSFEWLQRAFILGYFGSNEEAAQREYQKFVHELVGQEYPSPLKAVVAATVLGSQDFLSEIKETCLRRAQPRADVPASRQLAPSATMERIFNLVEKEFSANPAFARNLKMYLCQKYSRVPLKTLGQQFGISESAVSQARRRVLRHLEQDRELEHRIRALEASIMAGS